MIMFLFRTKPSSYKNSVFSYWTMNLKIDNNVPLLLSDSRRLGSSITKPGFRISASTLKFE